MRLNDISRAQLVAAWCAAVIVIGACSVAAGAALTLGNAEWWVATCLVPPAIMLLVWKGAPPVTVAELLYSVNSGSTESRQ